VTDASHDGWLPLSVATAGSTAATREVIDMHDTWVFRFSHEGVVAGELRVSRDDLARNGWTVRVPERVAQQLRTLDQLPGA
jgi:hypothetical protein